MPHIEYELRGAIGAITLNRPDKLNAFGGTMREELLSALRSAEEDLRCRVVVITGAGRAFSAGGDIEFMSSLQKARDVDSFGKLLDAGRNVILQIVSMRPPVIASINGVAAGAGCNLALACDYRIAADDAKLGQTFVKIGLHPDWGGTWLLPRAIGRARALELMATGRMIDAVDALEMGMIDRIVPSASLAEETAKLAESIAAAPPGAVADIKRALRQAEANDISSQLALEIEHQLRAFLSDDATEGMSAFFEKRAPRFQGR
jgi:2-(1,2-epoxy-1,2-dihydrophenyl)acetyl-CoA isomerase